MTIALDDIRNAIVTALNNAAVGTFHSYERYSKSSSSLIKLYGNPVMGGFIRKTGRRETSQALGRSRVRHRWEVVYLMAFDDEATSQLDFEDNLEALQQPFSSHIQLPELEQVSTWVNDRVGLEETDNQPVMFGNVLCHRSRMTLETEYYK